MFDLIWIQCVVSDVLHAVTHSQSSGSGYEGRVSVYARKGRFTSVKYVQNIIAVSNELRPKFEDRMLVNVLY